MTHIVTFNNQTDRSVVVLSVEKPCESVRIKPKDATSKAVPVSWWQNEPLVFATRKGVCHLWDHDWKIHAQWEGSPDMHILLDRDGGVGGKLKATVRPDGDIVLEKA